MKKLIPILFSAFALPAIAQTPISIIATDMVQIGDVINRKADTMTVFTGPGPAGANQAWTMTNLSSYVIDENTSVVARTSTSYSAQFPNSDIAMTNDNVSYVYVKTTNSTMTTQGGAGDLLMLGNTIVAPLNPDLTLHNFPRTYGSSFTDTYATDITINGSIISPLVNQIRYKRVGTVYDNTDGWGTLTTPVGTYDVLRVKREDRATDTIWILPTIGLPPTWSVYSTKKDTAFSYQWLGKEGKLAVAELNYDSLDQPKTYKWTTIQPLSVGVEEQATTIETQIYPVPASETLTLQVGSALEAGEYFFSIYDATGKMVMQEKVNASPSGKYLFSVSDLSTGLYSWQFTDQKQSGKDSGKLSIVR